MPKETKKVTIKEIVVAEPFVGLALELAGDLKTGNGAMHYSVLKDYLQHYVGWHATGKEWWMKSEAAYDVAIQALTKALDGNPNSVGLADAYVTVAEREV